MSERYPIPAELTRAELVIKNSRFITRIAPAASPHEAQAFVQSIREEHPDANHNCWAYVIGPPGSTGQIGMSDDGEPHNTAGRPMLNVLLHGALGDVVAVVTRYFGGIKLGRGGLVRAYGQAVKETLEQTPHAQKVEWAHLLITLDYASAPAVQRLLPTLEAQIQEERFEARVELKVRVPKERRAALERALEDATRGQATLAPADES